MTATSQDVPGLPSGHAKALGDCIAGIPKDLMSQRQPQSGPGAVLCPTGCTTSVHVTRSNWQAARGEVLLSPDVDP
jgi:hypothetical protein